MPLYHDGGFRRHVRVFIRHMGDGQALCHENRGWLYSARFQNLSGYSAGATMSDDIEVLARELVEASQRLEALYVMNQLEKYEDRVAAVIDIEKTKIRIAVASQKIKDYSEKQIRELTK